MAECHRQDRSVFESVISETVSTSSVFMVASIQAGGKRSVCVIDFIGAYMNSTLPEDHRAYICVMNITDSQVNQVIIFIHVDDIVLTAKTSCVNLRLYLGS